MYLRVFVRQQQGRHSARGTTTSPTPPSPHPKDGVRVQSSCWHRGCLRSTWRVRLACLAHQATTLSTAAPKDGRRRQAGWRHRLLTTSISPARRCSLPKALPHVSPLPRQPPQRLDRRRQADEVMEHVGPRGHAPTAGSSTLLEPQRKQATRRRGRQPLPSPRASSPSAAYSEAVARRSGGGRQGGVAGWRGTGTLRAPAAPGRRRWAQ